MRLLPPLPLNHFDTRIVRENSFRDVLEFIGPASSPSLSEKRAQLLLLRGTFFSDLTLDHDETNFCVGRVGGIDIKAFISARTNNSNPVMMHRRKQSNDGEFIVGKSGGDRLPWYGTTVACVSITGLALVWGGFTGE
jgi:hypothetical protein